VPEDVRASGLVTRDPYLKEAAELLTSRGCGEGWLLQPHIIDMPDLEYRSAPGMISFAFHSVFLLVFLCDPAYCIKGL
jgi:hypothetical protein